MKEDNIRFIIKKAGDASLVKRTSIGGTNDDDDVITIEYVLANEVTNVNHFYYY